MTLDPTENPGIDPNGSENPGAPATISAEDFEALRAEREQQAAKVAGLQNLVDKLRGVEKAYINLTKVLGENVTPEQLTEWKQAAAKLEEASHQREVLRIELEQQLKSTYEPQIQALEKQVDTFRNKYESLLIDTAVRDACLQLKANPVTLNYAASTLKQHIKLNDGKLVVLGPDKTTPLVVEDPQTKKVRSGTIGDLAVQLIEQDSAFASVFLPPDVGGVGASNRRMPGLANTVTMAEFNDRLRQGDTQLALDVKSGKVSVTG